MKVFKSNSGLSFENYVHLVHIDGNNYMVVISDHNETYGLGQIIEFEQYEIDELVETDLSIKDSPLYNPLFEHYIKQNFK